MNNVHMLLLAAVLLAMLLGGCACSDCNPYAAYGDCYNRYTGSNECGGQPCYQRTNASANRSLFYWPGSR